MIAGALLVIAGVVLVAVPVVSTWIRGNADDQALRDWNSGGSALVAGAPHDPDAIPGAATATPTANASSCQPGTAPPADYALLGFPSLAQHAYSGVAGNGDWNMLKQRSMVHYLTSAAPGEQGNVIVAFHREPHYEHIDQLAVGDTVTVQDRACKVFTYRITQRWTEAPAKVTQLVSTSGHDLTLITCTPWWRDYDRIVWRGTLVDTAAS
jgi:LPXTG-site transpeptidase (sortase) family protein